MNFYKILKSITILLVCVFSLYFSYLSYFFYDVVIGNIMQGTYSTYSIGKEILINTNETRENVIESIKNGLLKVTDKEKAEEIALENKIKKTTDLTEELERKKEQEKTKKILNLIPFFLSFLTFLVIIKFLLSLLINLIKVNGEIIEWVKK